MKIYSILQSALAEYQSNKEKALGGLDLSMFVNRRKDPYVRDGIGYVSLFGPLLKDAAPIDIMLGATSYDSIEDDTKYVLANGAKVIVFDIDSPGGTVSGLIETAEFIENLPVPSIGYIDGCCCSAAYHLAAGMSYLISTKSSCIGNVGAVLCYVDTSKMYDSLGIEFNVFTNEGAVMKSIGYTPSLTETQKEFLQESINETGRAFKQFVLDNRGDVGEEVWTAAWFNGMKALELGLIDSIGDEDDTIDYAKMLANRFSI